MLNWLKNILSREKTSKKEKTLSAIIAFGYVGVLGYAGSVAPGNWYEALAKPSVMPPNIVFRIVWPILFVL